MTVFPIQGSIESPAAAARREIAEEHRMLRTLLERLEATTDPEALDRRLGELERLAPKAQAIVEGPVAELRRGVAELCRRLHEHEAAETELLAGAMYDDLGGGE